jgi:hypothetical protein
MALSVKKGIQVPEQVTPTAPAAGSRLLYAKSTGWFDLNSAGVETNLFGVKITVASTAPSSPAVNDVWIDTT